MLNQVGGLEMLVVLLLGLFVFGPERLPGLAADAGKALRAVRTQIKGLTDDLKTELGPEVGDLDLASLHPKAVVKQHLGDDPEDEPEAEVVDRLAGRPRGRLPLTTGEVAPWDPDTT